MSQQSSPTNKQNLALDKNASMKYATKVHINNFQTIKHKGKKKNHILECYSTSLDKQFIPVLLALAARLPYKSFYV